MDFTGHEGWLVGYIIGLVVVLVVVALVVPILVIAWLPMKNTAGLAGLNETIDSALGVIAGLKRGRTRLGG